MVEHFPRILASEEKSTTTSTSRSSGSSYSSKSSSSNGRAAKDTLFDQRTLRISNCNGEQLVQKSMTVSD